MRTPDWLLWAAGYGGARCRCAARLAALHPYEVPEILALPVEAGHAPYLDWLAAQVAPLSD